MNMKSKNTILPKSLALSLLAFFMVESLSQAAVIIDGVAGQEGSSRIRDWDGTVDGDGDLSQTEQANLVGSLSWGPVTHAAYSFQLTQKFNVEEADFSISWTGTFGSPTWNVDVYASRVDASGTIIASDFEASNLIMENFVTTTDSQGNFSLDSGGKLALADFLNANWEEDSYVFITLKTNPLLTAQAGSTGYIFGGGTTADGQLFLTEVAPEPSTLGLLFAGIIVMAAKRKKLFA